MTGLEIGLIVLCSVLYVLGSFLLESLLMTTPSAPNWIAFEKEGWTFSEVATKYRFVRLTKPSTLFQLKYDYIVTCADRGIRLVAPANLLTDGASIPWFFRRVIGPPMHASYFPAAVIHDAAYEGTLKWYIKDVLYDYTRLDSDEIFSDIMDVLDVTGWRRNAMYKAVRSIFGKRAWDRNRI